MSDHPFVTAYDWFDREIARARRLPGKDRGDVAADLIMALLGVEGAGLSEPWRRYVRFRIGVELLEFGIDVTARSVLRVPTSEPPSGS